MFPGVSRKEQNSADTLSLTLKPVRLLADRTMRYICVVFSHQVYGHLLQQQEETNNILYMNVSSIKSESGKVGLLKAPCVVLAGSRMEYQWVALSPYLYTSVLLSPL